MHEITVKPSAAATGWVIEHPRAHSGTYHSGAAAEAAALGLARRIARTGAQVRTTVLLRDGSVGGVVLTDPADVDQGSA